MTDPALLVFAFAATLALALVSTAALRGRQGWLELRQLELGSRRSAPRARAPARVELSELRDRVRRLEAIANGVEG